jgi:hypothetical protein
LEHTDNLTQARHAHAAQDWATAAAHFDAVVPDRFTADDLAAYADAVWWLGRIEDNLRSEALRATLSGSDKSRPARPRLAALQLGLFHFSAGDEPSAWLG